MSAYKQPVSVLVVIHTPDAQVLLLERADHPGFWQSVTGSREDGEALIETAAREVREETGLVACPPMLSDWGIENCYEIYGHWRHRYAPGVTHNREHVFGLQVPEPVDVLLAPGEHTRWRWMRWDEATEVVFSPSNAEALRLLPGRLT